MNRRLTHQIWLRGPIPDQFRHWRSHMIAMNPGFEHMLWTDENVHLLGDASQWKHEHAAGSSNILRLLALQKYGGLYLDFDIEPIRPLYPLLIPDGFAAKQPDGVRCNAAMGFTPNHPAVEAMLTRAQELRDNDPAYACHLLDVYEDLFTTLPTEWFYSWNWDEEPKAVHPEAIVVHHWNFSWKSEQNAQEVV